MKTWTTAALLALCLVACSAAVWPPSAPHAVATGRLQWTADSPCSHPLLDVMLQYPLSDGCGTKLYLSGRLRPELVGQTVWVEGTLVRAKTCTLLEVATVSACGVAQPDADVGWTP